MKGILYRNYKQSGSEDGSDEEEKASELTEERLNQLAADIEDCQLNEEEAKQFELYIKENKQSLVGNLMPWWVPLSSSKVKNKSIGKVQAYQSVNLDIQDIDRQREFTQIQAISNKYNMNRLVVTVEKLKMLDEGSENDQDSEFEDVDVIDGEEEESADLINDIKTHYEILRYRYETVIPKSIFALLNKKKVRPAAKVREPSPLVQYLIFSNMASFLYYYRLWNGEMVVQTSENPDCGLPLAEAKAVCTALCTQLLSTESQFKVSEDPLNSAYMLDHLYYLSLFKDYQGLEGGKVKLNNTRANLAEFQPFILDNLRQFVTQVGFTGKTLGLNRKTVLIEGLFRYYDFLNDVEQTQLAVQKSKFLRSDQKLLKNIGLAK